MIVPSWRAVALMFAGVPIALAFGLSQAELWIAGPAWILATLALMGADTLAMRRPAQFRLGASLPSTLEAGRPADVLFRLEGRPPPRLEASLEADMRLDVQPQVQTMAGMNALRFTLTPRRRGTAAFARLHLRWQGPLGLTRRIRALALDRTVAVVPQISRVREEAVRLFSRNRAVGHALQPDPAESMEFHALREFQRGDNPRGVNWRQSARHAKLLVRETRAERNRTLMLAIDTGRLMSEPLAGGLPRLDHALNAALVLAYAGLKLGDRVGLFAFDTRPVLASGTVRGTAAFGALQRMAAALEYSTEESNYTLGLTELGGTLGGRALVIIMTDFADSTGAELMIENVGRLLQRHLVLFVAFQDDELTELAEAEPATPDDVSRAVVAGTLLAERDVVLARLRRMGAEVISAPAQQLGPALIRRYLDLKRQDRL